MLVKALLLISPPFQPPSPFHAVVISTGLNAWSSEIEHNLHRNVRNSSECWMFLREVSMEDSMLVL